MGESAVFVKTMEHLQNSVVPRENIFVGFFFFFKPILKLLVYFIKHPRISFFFFFFFFFFLLIQKIVCDILFYKIKFNKLNSKE